MSATIAQEREARIAEMIGNYMKKLTERTHHHMGWVWVAHYFRPVSKNIRIAIERHNW